MDWKSMNLGFMKVLLHEIDKSMSSKGMEEAIDPFWIEMRGKDHILPDIYSAVFRTN